MKLMDLLREQTEYWLAYTFVFNIGRNYHRVEYYTNYSRENGLIGKPVKVVESAKISDILKGLPSAQKKRVQSLAKAREDGVISPDGEYYRW